MRKIGMAMLIALLSVALPGYAKDSAPQFKSVEAKHFTKAEGVELSPEFTDYLYAELRAELTKAKLFGQVIGEGEVVDAADVPASIVIEGNITEYKKGSVAKDVLIGYTAGWRSMKIDTAIKQRGDQKVIVSPQIHVRASPRWKDKVLAKEAAQQIVKKLKEALKNSGAGS
jgi:Domain of unknown function (DUF4410)